MWFWEVSPRYWRPIHWIAAILICCLLISILLFGCAIESIVDNIFIVLSL